MSWKFQADQPIYTQLVARLQQQIVSGVYPPGSTAGKFVTEDAAAVAAARRSLAEAQTRQYLAAMRALGCGKQEIHNLFDQMEEQEHADL